MMSSTMVVTIAPTAAEKFGMKSAIAFTPSA
jgi:hypothetical protein